MAVFYFDIQVAAYLAQPIGVETRKYLARQAHSTELIAGQVIATFCQQALEKGIIKIDIMRDEDLAIEHIIDPVCHLPKRRCILDHRIGDAGEACDIVGDILARIDKRLVAIRDACTIMHIDSHLCDTIGRGMASRGLDIYDGI